MQPFQEDPLLASSPLDCPVLFWLHSFVLWELVGEGPPKSLPNASQDSPQSVTDAWARCTLLATGASDEEYALMLCLCQPILPTVSTHTWFILPGSE